MSRTRAATPAGKHRSNGRRASRAGGTATGAKPAAKPRRTAKRSPAKRTAAKRSSAKRATTKRRATARTGAPRRRPAPARRPRARRAASRRRRGWSRPRPLRAARGAFKAISWRYRVGVVAILAVSVAAGYLLWLRDSSLVAVTDVEVAGVSSGDRGRIVSELTRVAEGQTTLHADRAAIESAAAAFPTVESVDVDPNFPHGMRIEVTERPPTMLIEAEGRRLAVAADGTLLTGLEVPEAEAERLPVLEGGQLPDGATLEGEALQEALVIGAAPDPLRPLIEEVRHDRDHGVELTLRGAIPVRFGSGSRAAEKWAAAAAVLADPKLDALTYLDVRVPERPAAGGAGKPL